MYTQTGKKFRGNFVARVFLEMIENKNYLSLCLKKLFMFIKKIKGMYVSVFNTIPLCPTPSY